MSKNKIKSRVSLHEILFGDLGERGLCLETTIRDPNISREEAISMNKCGRFTRSYYHRYCHHYFLGEVKFLQINQSYKCMITIRLAAGYGGMIPFVEEMAKNELTKLEQDVGLKRAENFGRHIVNSLPDFNFEISMRRDEPFLAMASRVVVEICIALGVDISKKSDRGDGSYEIEQALKNVKTSREQQVLYRGKWMSEEDFRAKFIQDNIKEALLAHGAEVTKKT